MNGADWNEWISPFLISIKITTVASVLVFVLGILAAYWMSRHSFLGKSVLETVLILPLVLPPTVVGFLLLFIFGRNGWVGIAIEWVFHQPVVFTWVAAVVAVVVVAFPLVYQTAKVGFLSIDKELEDSARSMGASELNLFRWIVLPLAWRALLTGFLLGFARGLGEFGATFMFAGNIPHRTQTIPTAIYVAVESGDWTLAWLWTGTIIVLSLLLMWVVGTKLRN